MKLYLKYNDQYLKEYTFLDKEESLDMKDRKSWLKTREDIVEDIDDRWT